jgi:hypothetical protein
MINHLFKFEGGSSNQEALYLRNMNMFIASIKNLMKAENKLNNLEITEGDPRFPFEFNQYTTSEFIEELKTHDLGVYPLKLPFASIPKPE